MAQSHIADAAAASANVSDRMSKSLSALDVGCQGPWLKAHTLIGVSS